MRRMVVLLIACIMLVQAGAALAQGGLEVIPSAGYRWGGTMTSVNGFKSLDVKDNAVYGIGLGTMTPKNSEVELQWTHFEGNIVGTFNNGTQFEGQILKRDDIVLNGYWYAYRPTSSLKPFFTAGLGSAIFSHPDYATVGRFTWNLGIGFRKEFNEGLALRVSGKWTPVWITTGTGVWCDPWYCYSVGTGENFDQFEASGALVLKLGR